MEHIRGTSSSRSDPSAEIRAEEGGGDLHLCGIIYDIQNVPVSERRELEIRGWWRLKAERSRYKIIHKGPNLRVTMLFKPEKNGILTIFA